MHRIRLEAQKEGKINRYVMEKPLDLFKENEMKSLYIYQTSPPAVVIRAGGLQHPTTWYINGPPS